jgi:hypothetical protein
MSSYLIDNIILCKSQGYVAAPPNYLGQITTEPAKALLLLANGDSLSRPWRCADVSDHLAAARFSTQQFSASYDPHRLGRSDRGAFLQSSSPFAQLIPADNAMPFNACLVLSGSFLFPAHAGSEREASVDIAIRYRASLSRLADETNESDAILAEHLLSSFRAPIRRGDPVRRGPLSRQARQFFGGSRPDCLRSFKRRTRQSGRGAETR